MNTAWEHETECGASCSGCPDWTCPYMGIACDTPRDQHLCPKCSELVPQKSLYNVEYVDGEGDLEIKKVFLNDGELRTLMDTICEYGIDAKVYRLSPGPMPNLEGITPIVISGDDKKRLGLPDPCDH